MRSNILPAIFFSLCLLLPWASGQAAQTLTALPEQPLAPEFSLQDIEEKTWQLSDLQGKPAIVNFWATWCPPCRAEMPSMQRAWEQLQSQGVWLLAINVGESADTVLDFVMQHDLDFPLLLDPLGHSLEQWPAQGLPATFVLDPDGRIIFRAIGGREWDDPELLAPVLKLRR